MVVGCDLKIEAVRLVVIKTALLLDAAELVALAPDVILSIGSLSIASFYGLLV